MSPHGSFAPCLAVPKWAFLERSNTPNSSQEQESNSNIFSRRRMGRRAIALLISGREKGILNIFTVINAQINSPLSCQI